MARAGDPNSAGSQFFIVHEDSTFLDGQYTVFGRVIEGMDVADALFDEYGEAAGGGIRAGKQDPVFQAGNEYLKKNFPRLDYIRTARSKGLTERATIIKHALRNGMLPVLTFMGLQLGTLLGGSIIIEQILALPGIGTWNLTAIQTKDAPIIMAVTMYAAVVLFAALGLDPFLVVLPVAAAFFEHGLFHIGDLAPQFQVRHH